MSGVEGHSVRLRANSKVNLFLRVIGRRSDGYHEVETILHGIGLADDIELTANRHSVEIEMVNATGSAMQMPAAEDNLVVHAFHRMRERGDVDYAVHMRVVKRIPLGAGLGGGSADAAAVIRALNDLWELDFDRQTLMDVAADIGSDVPYCFAGGTCLATGKGEELTPLPAPDDLWFVLGLSNVPLLTRDVYSMVDELEPAPEIRSAPMTLALGAGDVVEIGALLHNDLEPAAFALRPELQTKKQRLLDAGALGAGLTGSGPTLFAPASDADDASAIAGRVRHDFDRVLVVRSTPEGIERLD